MRVPNEMKVNSTKVVGEFPEGLDIYDFEFKPGWNIEFKKNDKGKIIGATWTGTLHPYEFIEFGMLGINRRVHRSARVTVAVARNHAQETRPNRQCFEVIPDLSVPIPGYPEKPVARDCGAFRSSYVFSVRLLLSPPQIFPPGNRSLAVAAL